MIDEDEHDRQLACRIKWCYIIIGVAFVILLTLEYFF